MGSFSNLVKINLQKLCIVNIPRTFSDLSIYESPYGHL